MVYKGESTESLPAGSIPMDACQLIQDAIANDPQVGLVLEIAKRARDAEEYNIPTELEDSSEVVAIPTEQQYPTS
jgi:hypothetical protein